MSVRTVPGRSFSSPFSHVDLFGKELPSCPALSSVKTSDTIVLSGSDLLHDKRKCKKSKAKKKQHSSKASHSSVITGPSKTKGSKRSSRASLDLSGKGHKSRASDPRGGIMAPVDYDSTVQLPLRQPIVRRDSVEGGVTIKTQTTEDKKTKTRYSRAFSEPDFASRLSSGPLPDMKSVPLVKEERVKNSECIVPSHLRHASLSTSAYILKMTSTSLRSSSPSATSSAHVSTTTNGTSTSNFPTSSSSSASRPSPTFQSLLHGSVNASKVNVRLNTRASGARSFRTYSKSISERGGAEIGGVEEIMRGLKRMQFQQVIVLSGAGISTASGIPDFRQVYLYNVPNPSYVLV